MTNPLTNPPTNPFEDDDAQYLVLVNNEGQYSIWPAATAVPAGWTSVRPPDSRRASLDH
ncbi:MAG: MbtH protein, partial [Actinomycetota bacterium]|nr:MbtH protein [Actinomycetota bacterium]